MALVARSGSPRKVGLKKSSYSLICPAVDGIRAAAAVSVEPELKRVERDRLSRG
jgi:hypothetical protein